MASLSRCIAKFGKALSPEDVESIRSRMNEFGGDPVAAANDFLAQIKEERLQLVSDIVEKSREILSPNGTPFKTEAIAKKSKAYKANPGAEVVEVEGGFALRRAAQPTSSDDQASVKPKARIYDFGEKIGGAAKDSYRRRIDEPLPDDIKDITLAKHFPEPNWDKLLAEGVGAKELAMVRAMRDEIPSKPRKAYKVKRWVEQLETMRNFTARIFDGTYTADQLEALMLDFKKDEGIRRPLQSVVDRYTLMRDMGVPIKHKSLLGYELRKKHFNLYRGEENVDKWILAQRVNRSLGRSQGFDTREEGLQALEQILDKPESKEEQNHRTKLDIYRDTGSGQTWVGKKVAAGKFIDLYAAKDQKDARRELAENYDDLIVKLEKKKDIPQLRRSTNDPRIGEDYRKGKDVTPEEFSDEFGFRGTQFGNWVNQAKRQGDLNNAFDGLKDLAGILQVPPQALSLNGELGLAFGARGRGGKQAAAAHYETDKVVINLTKKAGAGSLAHEWWHAMDSYFNRSRTGADRYGFLSEGSKTQRTLPDGTLDTSVRPEMLKAFAGVVDAIRESGVMQRSKALDNTRSKDYWSTVRELTARSFERFVIDKSAEQGHQSDYLANVVSEESFDEPNYPYPTDSEAKAINKAFQNLFDVLDTKKTNRGTALYSKAATIAGEGIPLSEVEKQVATFFRRFKGANDGLRVSIYEKPQEAFGDQPGTDSLKAGYFPEQNELVLIASNLASTQDVQATLQHEILVHKGLGIFSKEVEQQLIIDIVENAPRSPSLAPMWRSVQDLYGDQSQREQAEELLAMIAESKLTRVDKFVNKIILALKKALQKIGLIRQGIGRRELLDKIYDIADAFQEGKTARSRNTGTKLSKKGGTPKSKAGHVLADTRDKWLGLVTRRHLVHMGKDILPGLLDFNHRAQRMDAFRNDQMAKNSKLAERWRKYIAQNREESARLTELMHNATIAGVDPAMPYEPILDMTKTKKKIRVIKEQARGRGGEAFKLQRKIKDLENSHGQERNRQQSYPELKEAWDKLSPQAKRLYKAVRDAYQDQTQLLVEALEDRIRHSVTHKKTQTALIDELRTKFEAHRTQAPYFPLARFGRYWLSVTENGENSFYMYEQSQDADAAYQKEVSRLGEDNVQLGKTFGDLKNFQQADAGFVTTIEQYIDQTPMDNVVRENLRDHIYQAYILTLPDVSIRKHFVHRKNTPGYNEDALRAFSHQMFHGSHQLARIKYGHLIHDSLDRIRADIDLAQNRTAFKRLQDEAATAKTPEERQKLQRRIKRIEKIQKDPARAVDYYDEAVKRQDWMMNPTGSYAANVASSIGFAWYLGLSPASALVNFSQTPLVTLPVLGARYGWSKASGALTKSLSQLVKGGGTLVTDNEDGTVETKLTPQELSAYRSWLSDGVLDKTLAHDLAGLSEEGQHHNDTHHRIMTVFSFQFHHAERINREVTALAGYRLAIDTGVSHEKAIEAGASAVWDSHFDYSSSNKARFMANDVAKIALQFRQFSLNMTYLLARNFHQSFKGESKEVQHEARKTLTGVLGMHAIAAGAMGMPLFSMLMTMLELLFDDEDDPFDGRTEFRNFLADAFGKEIGEVIAHGPVQAFTDIGIASRVSLNDLWFRDPGRVMEWDEWARYWLEQITGPLGALVGNAAYGAKLVGRGEIQKGVEFMVPKAFKDILRAIRFNEEGVTTSRGDPVMEDLSVAQLIQQGIGFVPGDLQERYEGNRAIINRKERLQRRRSELLRSWVTAKTSKKRSEAMSEIRNFNKGQSAYAIDFESLERSLLTRQSRSRNSVNGVVLSGRSRSLRNTAKFVN